MTVAAALDRSMRAASIPIDGVSLGKRADKATWSIQFTSEVTPEQRAQAQSVLDAFDPATVSPELRADFETAQQRLTDDEWVALQAACRDSVRLARWYERAKTRGRIDLNDREVQEAFGAVVAARLFSRERMFELFPDLAHSTWK